MLVSVYRKRIAATAIQLARDDPELVKIVIRRLRRSGDIERDDLVYLERIADNWIGVAKHNRERARAAQAALRCRRAEALPLSVPADPVGPRSAFAECRPG